MPKQPNYDSMSLEELDAEIIRLSNEEAPKAERRAATEAYDRKYAAEELQRKLGNASDAEREALAQYVRAEGIPSNESVGER